MQGVEYRSAAPRVVGGAPAGLSVSRALAQLEVAAFGL